ncbi:hypothetical protein LSH36_473g03010 [Paralvinella palmiformis]|uniref:Renin receptor n=1 Tax=Paralvinella palmiformis TaxID=53620 RepID=A0AAD9JAP2_9ANNE|nr:hypothetical protein LSH36_473g03010 [Paralvinella palmiformis]
MLLIIAQNEDLIDLRIRSLVHNVGLYTEAKHLEEQFSVLLWQWIAYNQTQLQLQMLVCSVLEPHKAKIKKRFNQAMTPTHYLANMLHPIYCGRNLPPEHIETAQEYVLEENPELLPELSIGQGSFYREIPPVTFSEFIVTHAPEHVQFVKDSEELPLSEIQDVISLTFGFDVDKDLSWKGLAAGNLFLRPKATILISVEGPQNLQLAIDGRAIYKTAEDVSELDTDNVAYNILNLAGKEEKPLIVDLSLESRVLEVRSHHPDLFRDVPATLDKLRDTFADGGSGLFSSAQLGSLNITKPNDLTFIGELHMIKTIIDAVQDKGQQLQGRLPNFFHFKIRGLQKMFDAYGDRSKQAEDAQKLLSDFIGQITAKLRQIYADNVVVEVVTVPRSQQTTRRMRHLLELDANPTASPVQVDLNLAAEYSDMYPIVFNMMLWFVIVMFITLLAISYGIWYMDPGRDSIIYRMTSQRMKKD